jgi:hypothetical protein
VDCASDENPAGHELQVEFEVAPTVVEKVPATQGKHCEIEDAPMTDE